MNTLYFGDNLDILREYIDDRSVDLIYLDPPFNSKAHYNVLFTTPQSELAAAQAEAFRDTWTWGNEASWSYEEVMRKGGTLARLIEALRSALGESDMMAYLVMMAVRLQEMKRVLKPSGALYLHCDPTASHYLKILLDGIFGANGFTNEIVWQRTTPKGLAFTRFATSHDVLLFYRSAGPIKWSAQYSPHRAEYVAKYYNLVDEKSGRRFQATSLLNPNKNRPNLRYEFHGHTKVWRWTRDRMKAAERDGRIYIPPNGGVPREKRFLDEQEGTPIADVWTDIPPVNSQARERIGYPTQKPLTLLDRIIRASSKEGDLVLDPFCGCGTTIEAAQRAGRQWIGIDVAVHAVKVIEARLREHFPRIKYTVEGMPKDFESAVKLAERDKYQFQWWANYLFNPHALREQKKGADRGIDGELFFPNGPGRPWGRMLTSVKGGTVGPSMVRDFRGVLERERAELGLFICLKRPTRAMITEAAAAGLANTVHGDIPRLQIVSIEDWFRKKLPALPPLEHLPSAAFSTARRRAQSKPKRVDPTQPQLPLSFTGGRAAGAKTHFNPAMVRMVSDEDRRSA